MRKPAKTAAVLLGLGIGATVGPSLGPASVWSGVATAALGVALSLVGTTKSDLVRDELVDHDEDAADGTTTGTAVVAERRRRNRQRPTLSGLGTRVELILKLAEEQASHHRAEARLQAEEIVTAARREADAILNRAHQQAAGISGTRQDPSPVPPTGAPSPDDDPSPHA